MFVKGVCKFEYLELRWSSGGNLASIIARQAVWIKSSALVPINYFSRRCVEGCDQFGSPACPVCAEGEICSLLAPTCDECQRTVCVAQTAAPVTINTVSKSSSSGSHEAGAIAGGVIAGVLTISIIIYLIWRNCIKSKRSLYQEHNWGEDSDDSGGTENSFMTRNTRASTHTVASLASTVFTRASNIIQIAYIPGTSNRSDPTSPVFLVPPVPPIPLALTSNYGSTPSFEQEHFFMPSDLRDSTYSTMSSQTSLGRNSVASTIYGNNAVISSISAQRGIRGKAAVVSVKSTGTMEGNIPPLPSFDHYSDTGMPSPAFSIGSTFLSRASEATQGKAQVVRVRNNMEDLKYYSPTEIRSQASNSTSYIDQPLSPNQGPFSDPFPYDYSSEKYIVTEDSKTSFRANFGSNLKNQLGEKNEMKEVKSLW
ncbi:hypothetical protein EPUL_005326 [Erysiphe pulchra]|uniref:Membrane anchor Opy2 N-terminal domain-containing protein n=1 Tax=Erysiphe pulchra TaxID=225359 RepID=A0A2S4PWW4_9PEZI|nr:hypothetical protein EPUL_005326 [Erysiphe pulchra]